MKASEFLSLHGKVIRHCGSVFHIIAVRLGKAVLVSAEGINGPAKGNLVKDLRGDKSTLGKELRKACNMGLVS